MRGLVRLGIIVAIAVLLLGFFGAWVQQLDSFAHVRHVMVAAVTIGALCALALRWWRMAAFGVVAVAAALLLSSPHLPFADPPTVGAGKFKLIQFNVRIHNPREAEAAQWIVSEKPDVVMLQEVLDETHPSFRLLDPIVPYRVRCKSAGFGDVAVYTRFPEIIQHCGEGDGLAWIQVKVDGTPLTFASLHLHWPWPFRQWEQLERLRPVFESMPQPVLLAGDFNATPWSAAVKAVEAMTKSKAISGYRTSLRLDVLHNGKPWPTVPIDHVLLPKGVEVRSVRMGPDMGSDHLPVIVEFDF
jgi:endonuclease/exonuclease/phosphatase (EEP) superfamily protein YafD